MSKFERVSRGYLRGRVQRALTDPPRGWVKIYSPSGELLAEMDPITRRRYPVKSRAQR